MTEERFEKAARLKRRGDFKRAYDDGRRAVSPFFVAFAVASTHGRLRLGVVASRRVGGAVERNRAKRLLREVFRKRRRSEDVSVDLVLVARGNILRASYRDVEEAFARFVPRVLGKAQAARGAGP